MDSAIAWLCRWTAQGLYVSILKCPLGALNSGMLQVLQPGDLIVSS